MGHVYVRFCLDWFCCDLYVWFHVCKVWTTWNALWWPYYAFDGAVSLQSINNVLVHSRQAWGGLGGGDYEKAPGLFFFHFSIHLHSFLIAVSMVNIQAQLLSLLLLLLLIACSKSRKPRWVISGLPRIHWIQNMHIIQTWNILTQSEGWSSRNCSVKKKRANEVRKCWYHWPFRSGV